MHFRARDCPVESNGFDTALRCKIATPVWHITLAATPFHDPLRRTAHRGGAPAVSLSHRARREPRSEREMLPPSTLQTNNDKWHPREHRTLLTLDDPRIDVLRGGETGGGSAKAPTPTAHGIHATTIGTRSARPGCPRTERRHRLCPLPRERSRCRELSLRCALPNAHHPSSRVFPVAIRETEVFGANATHAEVPVCLLATLLAFDDAHEHRHATVQPCGPSDEPRLDAGSPALSRRLT